MTALRPIDRHAARRRTGAWVVAAGLVVVGASVVWRLGLLQRPSLRQDELGFRKSAIHVVRPEYPFGLAQLGIQGVAVAEVSTGPAGLARTVEILESPHAEVSRVLSQALLQWRFPVVKLPGSYLAARVRGKLTYYFVIEGGVGLVRTPDEQAEVRQAGEGIPASPRAR